MLNNWIDCVKMNWLPLATVFSKRTCTMENNFLNFKWPHCPQETRRLNIWLVNSGAWICEHVRWGAVLTCKCSVSGTSDLTVLITFLYMNVLNESLPRILTTRYKLFQLTFTHMTIDLRHLWHCKINAVSEWCPFQDLGAQNGNPNGAGIPRLINFV